MALGPELGDQHRALGVGLGADPTDERQLRFVYEGENAGSLLALPTLTATFGAFVAIDDDRCRAAVRALASAGLDVGENQARRLLNDLAAFTAYHDLGGEDRLAFNAWKLEAALALGRSRPLTTQETCVAMVAALDDVVTWARTVTDWDQVAERVKALTVVEENEVCPPEVFKILAGAGLALLAARANLAAASLALATLVAGYQIGGQTTYFTRMVAEITSRPVKVFNCASASSLLSAGYTSTRGVCACGTAPTG
mgnify:CR=1 FL=1